MKKVIILLVLVCFATSAFAYDGRKMTASVSLGPYLPTESSLSGGADTEIGFTLSGDFHYYLNDYFGIGAFIMYNAFTLEDFDAGTVTDIETTFKSIILGVSASFRYPIEKFDFYVLGGVGIAFNDFEQEYKRSGIKYTASQDETGIAFKAEAGARYYITDMVSLGASGGYVFNEMDVDYYNGGKETEKLSGVTIAFTAGFSF